MTLAVAEEASVLPLPQARYNLILLETHEARLKALQAAHDSLLYEAQRLKQKQQSGTQQHLVVREKRQLASLIGKTHSARKRLINNMAPFIRYIVANSAHHNIPIEWKTQAREGTPYWCTAAGEPELVPSIAEKNSIVESYLKRQRAWEQVSTILPRETVDAMRFFAEVEKRAIAFIDCQNSQHDGQPISEGMHQYNLGCLALCQDVLGKASVCRLKCRAVWNSIETEIQSAQVIGCTTVSGDADGIPADRKVSATLPLLQMSQGPSTELLRDNIAVPDVLQEHARDDDQSEEQQLD